MSLPPIPLTVQPLLKSHEVPKLPMPGSRAEVPVDLLPPDVFTHINQQTAMTLEAVRRQREACFNQRRAHEHNLLERTRTTAAISRFELTQDVIYLLEIHANEFSALINRQDTWGRILWKLVNDIQVETGTKVLFADQICDRERSEFNRITITGAVEDVETARQRLFDVLPLQVGLRLTTVKAELEAKDLRETVAHWVYNGAFDFPTVSLHFLIDRENSTVEQRRYSQVLIRAAPHDKARLISAARRFAELVLENSEEAEYTWGFVIPKINRDWYIGQKAELIRDVAKRFSVMVSYPLSAAAGAEHNYIVHGDLENVINASHAFRDISPVSLTFDVEEPDLVKPPPNRQRMADVFDDECNVVVSYRKSPLEGEFRRSDEPVRHRVTVSTSFENRAMLFEMRRRLLKSMSNSPALECPPLKFGTHLRALLSAYSDKQLNKD